MGTEKIVYELTEELVRRGHKVYLFAALGSRSKANLITYLSIPTLSTIHLPVNRRGKYPVYVSRNARQLMGNNIGFYVYNGINTNEYEFSTQKHGYLLFIGRIIRNKGVLQAIEVAEKTGKKLIIAGPVRASHFFRSEIKPFIQKNANIHYVGPVGGKLKQQLIKHAECVLFPTLWRETFGLVMIESMACGTPVLALRKASLPEVLSGFPNLICNNVSEMIVKVRQKNYPPPYILRN